MKFKTLVIEIPIEGNDLKEGDVDNFLRSAKKAVCINIDLIRPSGRCATETISYDLSVDNFTVNART